MRERELQVSYRSALAPYLHQFVEEKRALGYRYHAQAQWLVAFDRFLLERGITSPDLPKEVVGAWACRRPHESISTQQNRIRLVQQLGLFLTRRGFSPYLPGGHLVPRGRSPFVPHIFTQEQVSRFLAAADRMQPSLHSPRREVMLPLLFRLLYGCGLRSSEARRLRIRDVDLARRLLVIREGKFRKDRLVPIAPSLAARLQSYLTTHACSREADDLLFPAPDGGPLAPQTIHDAFRQLLWACRISHGGRGRGPRLHDFRHTFAVHRLMRWYREGMDLGAALPILATYLGHLSLCGTQRYLRLTAEIYPDLIAALQARFGEVIPRKERP